MRMVKIKNKISGGGFMSKKGYTRQALFGDINHYDNNGRKTAQSTRGLFGDYNHKKK